jgi:hypothetical protein
VRPQGNCGYIPATPASGYAWPSFLNSLAGGTQITLAGTASYLTGSAQSLGCPTGGVVVTSVTVGKPGPTPTPNPSSTPSPAPSPTSTPITGGNTLPWVYSEIWSPTSPFRTSVAQQKAQGATVVPQQYMNSLWSQSIAGNGTYAGSPIYVAKTSDPLLTTTCTDFGGNCDAKNVQIHVPAYAVAQKAADGHIVVIDQNSGSGPIEIDCWQASVSGSHFYCAWAGTYALNGPGTSENGSEGIHGGMAMSTVFTSGAELINGHIDHALGMNTSCLNNPMVYPADTTFGSDQTCDSSTNPPHYGNLMHLLWTPAHIASSSYSAPCKVILTALANYGAYLNDTGNNGLQLNTASDLSYTANPATAGQDPWPGIQSQLNSAGDGSGSNWNSCLNRLQSSDLELIQIAHS